MFCAAAALALLLLASVSQTAPLACPDSLRPLDHLDLRRLEGRWALIAGSLSHLPYLERFRARDSAAINFSRNTTVTSVSYTRSLRVDNKCQHHSYDISLEGSSFTYNGTDNSNSSHTLVHTSCHDCLLMHMNVESGKRHHFYLFSRRRKLDQGELEEFRAQVECLNLPPPAVMDPTKELCREEAAGDPTAQPAEKTEGQKD